MTVTLLLRSGWSIVRSALLAKGGTSKKRLSLHLHEVLTQTNKVSPQTLQMALILSSHLGIRLGTKLSRPFRFYNQNFVCIFHLVYVCYMPHSSHPP
jgi:hypothetical protein